MMTNFQNLLHVSLVLFLQKELDAAEFFPITATQSNTLLQKPAGYAIDKDVSTCSLAGIGGGSSDLGWWQIDLGSPFLVISVALTNTNDSYEAQFLQNFVILVSKSNSTDVQSSNICTTFNNGSSVSPGSQINLTCSPNPLVGRYVTIKRQGGFRQDSVSLCEIEIIRNPSDGYLYLYNLPTYQRGVYQDLVSSRAVDLDVESCALSVDPNNTNGQWYIDLMNNYAITSVTLFNSKQGSTSYMSYFRITVGSTTDVNSQTLCYDYNKAVPAGGNDTISCDKVSVGRYLSITRYGSDNQKALWLCEIYIKGQIFLEGSSSTTQSSSSFRSTSTSSRPSTTTTTFSTPLSYPIQTIRSSTTTTIASVSNPSSSSDSPISPKQVNTNQCSDKECTDRITGLTAAVIALAIILGLSLVVIAVLVVYIIRQKRLDRTKPTTAANNPPEAAMSYEKLRFDAQSSSNTGDYDKLQTQEVRTVADPTYEEVRSNSDSNPNTV